MSYCSLNSSKEAVRYKNRKNEGEEEQDEEVLISSLRNENQSSEGERRCFPQLNIYFYLFSTLVTVLILSLALSILYFHTSVFRSSQSGSCVPLNQVGEVIVVSEITHFPSCTDNKTCHSFLKVIEQKHDGLKYNFVIGERGELYIGAGFKCLINNNDNTLYVKFLRSEHLELFDGYKRMCIRLSEIINHGISCEKISPNFKIQDEKKMCRVLESNKNRSYHIHDPNHVTKLIHSDFEWSFCGGFSTTKNVKKDKVITKENFPSCSPLLLVDEVIVDISDAQGPECVGLPLIASCLEEFREEYRERLNYNFIIRYDTGIYDSSGFKCSVDSTLRDTLKIKVLRKPKLNFMVYDTLEKLVLIILKQGLTCGKISETFSLKVNCNSSVQEDVDKCSKVNQTFSNIDGRKLKHEEDFGHFESILMDVYEFCHENHNTITPMAEPISTTTNWPIIASDTSCIPFRKVDKVRLITEKTNYSCSNNESCPSLLDTIEKEHDGLRYNFVIGPEGELYIGAGFKCIADIEENVLHVKLLLSEGSASGTFNTMSKNSSLNAVCSRLSELMEQGIMCDKISQDYDTVSEFLHSYNTSSVFNAKTNNLTDQSVTQTCRLGDETYKNRSDHLHDPDYKIRTLIPKNSKWTFCGDFSETVTHVLIIANTHSGKPKHLNENALIYCTDDGVTILMTPIEYSDGYLEEYHKLKPNTPETSCSPLGYMREIILTGASTTNCSVSSEARRYNFIIGDESVCIGSGFGCKADNESVEEKPQTLIVGLRQYLLEFACEFPQYFLKDHLFLQIVEGVLACSEISDVSVTLHCLEPFHVLHIPLSVNDEEYNTNFEAPSFDSGSMMTIGAIIPRKLRYQSCPDTTSPGLLPMPTIDTSIMPTWEDKESGSIDNIEDDIYTEDDFPYGPDLY